MAQPTMNGRRVVLPALAAVRCAQQGLGTIISPSPVSSVGPYTPETQSPLTDYCDSSAPSTHQSPAEQPPSSELEQLAADAALALENLPPGARQSALKFRSAMTNVVDNKCISQAAASAVRNLQLGVQMKVLMRSVRQPCARPNEDGSDVSGALSGLLANARSHGDRLLADLEAHLTQMARCIIVDKVPSDLLPLHGCRLGVDPTCYNPRHVLTASGVCPIIVVALFELRRMFITYTEFAIKLSHTAPTSALAARARAVKRDLYLMTGTYTNLVMHAFENMVSLLEVAAVA